MRRHHESERTKYPVKSLIKALRVLDMLSESEHGYGVTELSRHLHINKSGVHRLLATLKDEAYVMLDPISGRYILGSKIARLNEQLNHQSALLSVGLSIARRLSKDANETVNVGILEGRSVLYLAKQETSEPLRVSGQIGRRLPAYCTALGKALLSGMPDQIVRELYNDGGMLKKLAPKTLDSVDELLADIKRTRREGVAFDDEEMYPGLNCLAAPVRDFSGRVVAALSISIPKYRLKNKDLPRFKKLLLDASAEFSRGLGHAAASEASSK